ncbi:T9SS type A sorting domain-containing protein [Flavobacterium sp. JP2137]|uniref:Ig-like domain-containing protein n=1 Tax=Flavobacterium sp. JP2137 TaxID=3414510 RepID=UPI003D2FDC33
MRTVLLLLIVLLCWSGSAQEYAALTIATGFNADVVANGVGPASASTTHRLDNDSFNLLSRDFKATPDSPDSDVGLPVDRSISAANIAGLRFQMGDYSQPNALRLGQTNAAGTLAFGTAVKAKKLYLLATAGNAASAPVHFSAILQFEGGTSQTAADLTVADWFAGTTAATVISGLGRVNALTDVVETPTGNPKLFSVEITLDEANQLKNLTGVQLTKISSSEGVLNVFAATAVIVPDCPEPTAVIVQNIRDTAATIKWTAPTVAPDMGYEYEVRTSGEPGSGTTGLAVSDTVANTTLTAEFSALTGATEYAVYLRAKCTDTSWSTWVKKVFKTPCSYPELTVTDGTACGSGAVTLKATVSSGTAKWYASSSSRTPIGRGTLFTTPVLESTTNYWVAAEAANTQRGTAGKSTVASNASTLTLSNLGIVFDVAHPIELKSVSLYSTTEGTVKIKITNSYGVELYSTDVVNIVNTGVTNPNIIPLNVELPVGVGYRMLLKEATGVTLLFDNDSSLVQFPYVDSNGSMTVTASRWMGTEFTSLYYYFYNIKYNKSCTSPRKKVVATITRAPNFTLSSDFEFVCVGYPTNAVTVATGRDSYDSYVWTPATGVTGDAQSGWVFTPSESTVYQLKASQTSGEKCQVFRSVDVLTQPSPELTFMPEVDPPPVCGSDIVPLGVMYDNDKSMVVGTAVPTTFSNAVSAFNNYSSSARVQLLFTAAELRSHGMLVGPISAISFEVSSLGANENNWNYKVRIAPTTLTKFMSSYIERGFTTVFYAETYTHTASGWQEIVFDTPYYWDGVTNLIIDLDYRGTNFSSNANTLYTPTTERRMIHSSYNSASKTTSVNRFNTKFRQYFSYRVNWEAAGQGLFVDPEAQIPYVPNTNMRKVFYRPQQEGLNQIFAKVDLYGCKAEKEFKVQANFKAMPEAEDVQVFCGHPTVAELEASGHNLKWYDREFGGVPLQNADSLRAATYYVAQNIDGCASLRKATRVELLIQPDKPIYTRRVLCGEVYLRDLDLQYLEGNTLQWYDEYGNPITSDLRLSSELQTYYVSQSNTDCESQHTRLELGVHPVPVAPTANRLVVCGHARVSDLRVQSLPGAVIKCYYDAQSTQPLHATDLLSTRTYYLTQTLAGCESERVAVAVSTYAAVPIPLAQNQSFCTTDIRVADLEVIPLDGARVNWYNALHATVALAENQILRSGVYYVSQTLGECESPRTRVGVHIGEKPEAPQITSQQFCGRATVSQLRVNTPDDMVAKWYTEAVGGEALSAEDILQNGWYYASLSWHDCESPRIRFEVTINAIPDSPTGIPVQEFTTQAVVGDLVVDQEDVAWFSSLSDAQYFRNRLWSDIPLTDHNIYYAVVQAATGCWSKPFAVQVHINLNAVSFDAKSFRYYPNPVRDVLTLSHRETIHKVVVYSLSGQQLFVVKAADSTVEVPMDALPKETYVVKVYTATTTEVFKVIKN